MNDAPLIFSAPMVRALLDGRKTQTRRRVWRAKGAPNDPTMPSLTPWFRRYERWRAGDRELWIWTKETWGDLDADHPLCVDGRKPQPGDKLVYRANPGDDYQWSAPVGHPGLADFVWRSSMHQYRWASRLTLQVRDMRMERLHDISEEDARAEGALKMLMDDDGKFYEGPTFEGGTYRTGFAGLWAHIHGPESWARNDEIIAISFTVHKTNIDAIERKAP